MKEGKNLLKMVLVISFNKVIVKWSHEGFFSSYSIVTMIIILIPVRYVKIDSVLDKAERYDKEDMIERSPSYKDDRVFFVI